MKLTDKGFIEIPEGICSALDRTKWECWISPDCKFAASRKDGTRNFDYAPWLNDRRINGHGIYLWGIRTLENHHRFVHVGISALRTSTLADRTKVHLRGQLKATDRVHKVTFSESDPYGTLGRDFRHTVESKEVASDFISRLSVFYLLPVGNISDYQIRALEGVIAYAGADLLDTQDREGDEYWETTNTLSKVFPWTPEAIKVKRVAGILNNAFGVRIFPDESRRKKN